MIVLGRGKNESIMIGDDIMVMVVEVREDKVRLGIEAPRDTPVHRTEVYRALQRAQPWSSSDVSTDMPDG